MEIALIEPFFSGSHKRWAEELSRFSSHDFHLFTLPGRHWKWRMHGGAISLAEKWKAHYRHHPLPDAVLASDMLDLSTFQALIGKPEIPFHLYFHENQITYPWSAADKDVSLKRDNHYCFINFTSALCADRIWFNSLYHKQSFLLSLPAFLDQFPDQKLHHLIPSIERKSEVLPLGMDLSRMDACKDSSHLHDDPPVILWNHRWEYDKNPESFFRILFRLKEEGASFRLVVLGASFRNIPPVFSEAREKLADHILHFGYARDTEEYYRWLWKSDILPVTGIQDFFGGSVVEAIYAACLPLLPDRLAYPAHIPEALQNQLLYRKEEELLEKLRFFLRQPEQIPDYTDLCQNFVKRYDWSILGPVYDSLLSEHDKNQKT